MTQPATSEEPTKLDASLFNGDLHYMQSYIAGILIRAIPGCRPQSIGGCVRDTIWLDHPSAPKDADIEVFGATLDQITTAIQERYGDVVDTVGKQFAVIKIKGLPIDISVPRIEVCTGIGHKDFVVTTDVNMDVETAALRRDFTINTVGFDWHSGAYTDPFNGINHIKARLLHPVSDKFEEDPVRPLRAMQFIARFDMIPSHELVRRCAAMRDKVAALPKERIQTEWNKLMLQGRVISKGIKFLEDTGLIHLYPELAALNGVPQSPIHHPEGDVLTHTKLCLDAFADKARIGIEADDLALGYAIICHDFGKATCTVVGADGAVSAHGHEGASVPLARSFMERMFDGQQAIVPTVEKLVAAHMRPVQLYNSEGGLPAIRRLSLAVDGRIDTLLRLVECDQRGRHPAPFSSNPMQWTMDMVLKAGVTKEGPKPIMMGRHLIQHFNMKPGPEFSTILADAFEAQLDGKFSDEASGLEYLRSSLPRVT